MQRDIQVYINYSLTKGRNDWKKKIIIQIARMATIRTKKTEICRTHGNRPGAATMRMRRMTRMRRMMRLRMRWTGMQRKRATRPTTPGIKMLRRAMRWTLETGFRTCSTSPTSTVCSGAWTQVKKKTKTLMYKSIKKMKEVVADIKIQSRHLYSLMFAVLHK